MESRVTSLTDKPSWNSLVKLLSPLNRCHNNSLALFLEQGPGSDQAHDLIGALEDLAYA